MKNAQIEVPRLVRMKRGALARLGLYLARPGMARVALLHSEGLLEEILAPALEGMREQGIEVVLRHEVKDASVEQAVKLMAAVPRGCKAMVGLGGGKALDVSKYTASLLGLTYLAAPTSLSNDGFCSPQASLTLEGRRRSLPTGLPYGVVVDVEVCGRAPRVLWHSGIGDLSSKFTAVWDWKLAFHAAGTAVNDLAALMSDASVYQLLANPSADEEGIRLLATALMMNGVAMEVAGSSRPASGSEHLISHALDMHAARPRMHGLQVGVATYLISGLQGNPHRRRIAELFDRTGFWASIRRDPFSLADWEQAVRLAPGVKDDFHTVLTGRDAWPEFKRMIADDPRLAGCFA